MQETIIWNWSLEVPTSRSLSAMAATSRSLAILNADGKAQRIALESGDSAKLSGKAETPLPVDVKGVVQFTAPDGKVRQGQFK